MTATTSGRGPIIKVRGLEKFFGPTHILKGVSMDVKAGEVVVIMGPSGAGKSTFLRCLNFLETPTAGTVEIDGLAIDAEEPPGPRDKRIQILRRTASMIFQDFNLFPHMTVVENIIQGAVLVKGVSKKQALARADALLAEMGLQAKRGRYPAQLASGEQQQVAIARSLCMEPKILLFDDPTASLDPGLATAFLRRVARLSEAGMAILIATNDPYLARNAAHRVYLLDGGVWVEFGPPHILFENPKKERTRRFLANITLKDVWEGPD